MLGEHAGAAAASVELLSPSLRSSLAALWTQRAQSEAATGGAFARVLAALRRAEAIDAVVDLATQAVAEEARHAEVCRALACVYAGASVTIETGELPRVPRYAGVDDMRAIAALHVSGMCAVNETLACVFVEACMHDASETWLREIHRAHLRDEVGHARIGFAHLASPAVDADVRAVVAAWLPRIVTANVENWLSRLETLPVAGVIGHGYPPRADLREVVRAAVGDLIVPGFAHVGVTPPSSNHSRSHRS